MVQSQVSSIARPRLCVFPSSIQRKIVGPQWFEKLLEGDGGWVGVSATTWLSWLSNGLSAPLQTYPSGSWLLRLKFIRDDYIGDIGSWTFDGLMPNTLITVHREVEKR